MTCSEEIFKIWSGHEITHESQWEITPKVRYVVHARACSTYQWSLMNTYQRVFKL